MACAKLQVRLLIAFVQLGKRAGWWREQIVEPSAECVIRALEICISSRFTMALLAASFINVLLTWPFSLGG